MTAEPTEDNVMANETEAARQPGGRQGQGAESRESGTARGSTRSGAVQSPQRQGGREVGESRRGSWMPSQPRGPFTFIRRIAEEMDRLFDDLGMPSPQGGYYGAGERETGWEPHIEACARGGKFLVRADLPGLERNDVNVEIEDDELVISGERRREDEQEREGYWTSEFEYGRFMRRLPLPEGVDPEAASATFRNGVLHVEMPLREQRQQRGRRIEIREGGGASATSAATGEQKTSERR
jgi:HSP20 family protein